jgi:hypothetical protein
MRRGLGCLVKGFVVSLGVAAVAVLVLLVWLRASSVVGDFRFEDYVVRSLDRGQVERFLARAPGIRDASRSIDAYLKRTENADGLVARWFEKDKKRGSMWYFHAVIRRAQVTCWRKLEATKEEHPVWDEYCNFVGTLRVAPGEANCQLTLGEAVFEFPGTTLFRWDVSARYFAYYEQGKEGPNHSALFARTRPQQRIVLPTTTTLSIFVKGNKVLVIENVAMQFADYTGHVVAEAVLRWFMVEDSDGELRLVRQGALRVPGLYSFLLDDVSPDLRYAVVEGEIHGYHLRRILLCEIETSDCRVVARGLTTFSVFFLPEDPLKGPSPAESPGR